MVLAHLIGRLFLVYNIVEDNLLSLGQEQENGRKPIMLRLSHANSEILTHYDLLVPINDNMLEHGTQGVVQAPPTKVSNRKLQAKAKSFVPTAGKRERSRAAFKTDAEENAAPCSGPRSVPCAMPKVTSVAPAAAAATKILWQISQKGHETSPTKTMPGKKAAARGRAIHRSNLDRSKLSASSGPPQGRIMAPILSAPTSQPSYYQVLNEGSNDCAPKPDDLLMSGDNDKGVSKLGAEIQLAPAATISVLEKPFIPRTTPN